MVGCSSFTTQFLNLQLSAVTVRELPMSTRLVLTEHVEKTAAAIALRQIHSA